MHWMRRVAWRLEVLFRKDRAEEELDEELRYHLDREIRENVAKGMSPAEARRKAMVVFGGVERTKEQVRDVRGGRGLDDLRQDVRYTLRSMGKSPAFFTAVVMTLAVGIGTTVAMFSILDAALLRSQPYPDPDRLVVGRATFNGDVSPYASFPDYLDYRDGSNAFQVMAAFIPQTMPVPVTGSDTPAMAAACMVTADFFRALAVEPEIGRTFIPEEGEPNAAEVVVISHGFWQRWFGGDPEVVGRTLNIAGSTATVVGVMPPTFYFRFHVDAWVPVRYGMLDTENRRSHSWQAVGRMSEGMSLKQAQAQIDVISAQLAARYPDTHENEGFRLTPLGEALAEGYRPALLVLMGATVLLLFIACGNVAGLLMARATSRRTELSVRTALGAKRQRLVRQLFTESLFLAVAAGGFGVLLALWLQRLILALFPLDLLGITEVGLSGSMLAFALLLSVGTALLFGAAPAVTASRANPSQDLKSNLRTTSGGKGGRVRGGLVAVQVALSVVLLTGSGLLIRSFVRLQSVDLGFQAEGLVAANLSPEPRKYEDQEALDQFFEGVLDDVRALPQVVAASLVDKVPILHPWTNWEVWDPDNPPDESKSGPSAFARFVAPGYFDVMGVPIVQGRDHERQDKDNPLPPVVVNQALAEALFPHEDPIGRHLSVNFVMAELRDYEIVGVSGNMRITAVSQSPGYQMYFGYDEIHPIPSASRQLMVRVRGDMASVIPEIRRKVLGRDPDAPLTEVSTMTDVVSASLTGNRVLSLATALFAVMALLLSMTGLYAVLAYYVSRRTREIGIRVAFGATGGRVMRSVVGRGLVLVVAGLGVGVACAYAAGRLLQAQLYQVEPTDPLTFVSVATGLLVIGVLASLLPARRAARVDPVRTMHVE